MIVTMVAVSKGVDIFQVASQYANCNGFPLLYTKRVQGNKKISI